MANKISLRKFCCNSTCRQAEVEQDIGRLLAAIEEVILHGPDAAFSALALVYEIREKYSCQQSNG